MKLYLIKSICTIIKVERNSSKTGAIIIIFSNQRTNDQFAHSNMHYAYRCQFSAKMRERCNLLLFFLRVSGLICNLVYNDFIKIN